MKRKIAAIIAIVLTLVMVTGTVAYADKGRRIDNAIDKAQERLDFLKQIEPLIEDIKENKTIIASLRVQLKDQRQLAMAHIEALKSDPSTITDEQIQAMKAIRAKIQAARSIFASTNPQMSAAKHALRIVRKEKNYEAVITAYNNIISKQQTRIEQLNKLIDLYKQIAVL